LDIATRVSPSRRVECSRTGALRVRVWGNTATWPPATPPAALCVDTDASNPCAKLMLTLLAGVAEFERELIVERTVAGIEAARKRGVQLGRRPRVFRRAEVIRLRT